MPQAEGSTVIGRTVTIRGELSGSEDLTFDGTFEGSISLPNGRLTVGANARVKADVTVRDLVVLGVLDGNIQATGRVELRQTAVVQGDLAASRLSMEEGAALKGRVKLESASQPGQPE